MKLRFRFLLIAAPLCTPATVATYLLSNVATRSIHFTEKEVDGASYLQPVGELQNLVASYSLALQGSTAADEKNLLRGREALAASLAEVELFSSDLQPDLQSPETLPELRSTSKDGALAHVNEAVHLQVHWIADQSNLILDPKLDSFNLMDSVVLKLPELL